MSPKNRTGSKKYEKNQANRKVRRYKSELTNGGWYKKVKDFWYSKAFE